MDSCLLSKCYQINILSCCRLGVETTVEGVADAEERSRRSGGYVGDGRTSVCKSAPGAHEPEYSLQEGRTHDAAIAPSVLRTRLCGTGMNVINNLDAAKWRILSMCLTM